MVARCSSSPLRAIGNHQTAALQCSSIGIPPPRLHCGRAANYGSIIVPLRLSLPARVRPGLCCNGFIALPFASWRACSLAQRLLTSQRRECICLDVYSVVKVRSVRSHYAIGNFLRVIGLKTFAVFHNCAPLHICSAFPDRIASHLINGNFWSKNLKKVFSQLAFLFCPSITSQRERPKITLPSKLF